MITVRKRLISMLSAVVLVLSLFALLPEGALKAHALSGSGTADDPFIVTTYDELYEFAKNIKYNIQVQNLSGEVHIKLGNDIISEDKNNGYIISFGSYGGTVYFDLAGHILRRKTTLTIDKALFNLYDPNTVFVLDDSVGGGSVECGFKDSFSTVFSVRWGTLIVNNGRIKNDDTGVQQKYNDPTQYDFFRSDIHREYGGTVIINGGEIQGNLWADVHNTNAEYESGVSIYGGKINSIYYDVWSNSSRLNIYNCETKSIQHSYHKTTTLDKIIDENSTVLKDDKVYTREMLKNCTEMNCDNRILIYKKKAITGMRWEGTKLYWDKYPLASKYGLQIEKPLPGGGYTAVANTATTDTEFDFGMFFENNGVGKYRITVGAETDDGILLSLVTHSNTIEYDPRETVSEISLAVTEPKDGVTITKAIPSSTGEKRYTVTKSLWFKGTSTSGAAMESTEKFVEGQTYTLYCEVRAATGYKFISPSAKVNGKTAATVNYSGNGIVSVKQTFTAPLNIKTVNVTVTEPVAGAKPTVGDVTLTGAGAAIAPVNVKKNGSTVKLENTVSWFLGDEALDVATSTFEAGKTYTAAVYLKALDGYNIVNNDIKVYINGKQAELDPASLVSLILYGTAIYKADFECASSGQHWQKGDVNHDGEVDRIDANLLSRYVAGWDGYESRIYKDVADLNGDGNVDRIDANILSRCVADWDGYRDKYIK